MEEFELYRFNSPSKSNVNFRFPELLNHSGNSIPISSETFKSNPEFFSSVGRSYYIISINRNAAEYKELLLPGMNNWINWLDSGLIDLVRQGKCKLVLQIVVETILYADIKTIMDQAIELLGSGDSFEIWTPYVPPQATTRAATLSFKHKGIIKDYPYWENFVVNNLSSRSISLPRTKKYISLCRRYTYERLVAHSYIVSHDLLDYGFNSIPSIDTVYPDSNLIRALEYILKRNLFEKEIKDTLTYYQTNPLGFTLDQVPVLDTDRTMFSNNFIGWKENTDLEPYYAQSYLSLVQEGETTNGSFMLTEKIYRSILYKHLFLVIGPPNILAALKERGYKTFSELWPEDYDTMTNDVQRITRVLNIFEDLVKNKNLDDIYNMAKPIIEHNYNILQERSKLQVP
jgi:hypothetical protein